jgi:predicted methyltransferase
MADAAPQMFKACFDVLKPGGVLGVTDHRAKPGTTTEETKKSGYIPEDVIIKLATDAGFKLAGKSEINANPKDTKDWPKGVWTLPPTLELGDKDREKYLAIGESDRMTLKFVKPGTDKIFAAPESSKH